MINDKEVKIPSVQTKQGDIIKPVDFEKVHLREGFVLPEWLKANVKDKYVEVERMPTMEDLSGVVNLQLIVEFYSR